MYFSEALETLALHTLQNRPSIRFTLALKVSSGSSVDNKSRRHKHCKSILIFHLLNSPSWPCKLVLSLTFLALKAICSNRCKTIAHFFFITILSHKTLGRGSGMLSLLFYVCRWYLCVCVLKAHHQWMVCNTRRSPSVSRIPQF